MFKRNLSLLILYIYFVYIHIKNKILLLNTTKYAKILRKNKKYGGRIMRKVIVAGNWKMNKTAKEAAEFFCRI